MVNTRKFSEFTDAGTQAEGQTTVGLDGGNNARFTTAPQFLPAGPTGDRPDPATAGMIRYNTSLNNYEFYNGTQWAQFEDSADIALLIARLAAHTAGDGASMIGLQNQGSVTGQTVQNMAEADFIVKSVKSALVNAIALSDLSTGILVNETGTGNLVARSVAGTANQTTVTNGSGLAGNPTIAIANNPTLPGASHVQIPFGTTAQRPVTPTNGYFRYNTTLDELEYWNNNALAWEQVENSGAVLSVVGTANEIDVDSTDPVNPVLSLSATLNLPGSFTVQGSTVINEIIDDDTMASATDGNLSTSEAIKAYVDANAGGGVPVGTMIDYAGTSAPADFLMCDGSAIDRTTYADLFTAIGETWGAGDGSTTFNLPDFRRRTAVGSGGTGTGELGNSVGNTGGAETHTLTQDQMPSHNHSYNSINLVSVATPGSNIFGNNAGNTGNRGGGGAHNNMQPSAVVLKCIKYQ